MEYMTCVPGKKTSPPNNCRVSLRGHLPRRSSRSAETREAGENSSLLLRIAEIPRQIAGDLGYLDPPARVSVNLHPKASECLISLNEMAIARFELTHGHALASPAGAGDWQTQTIGREVGRRRLRA